MLESKAGDCIRSVDMDEEGWKHKEFYEVSIDGGKVQLVKHILHFPQLLSH
jgi:hypothetical protein